MNLKLIFSILLCTSVTYQTGLLRKKKVTKVNAIQTQCRNLMPKIEDVKRFAWFAAASICPDDKLLDWSCKACKGTNSTNKPVIKIFDFNWLTVRAYVAVDSDRKQIVVSFRGGIGIRNALTFLDRKFTTFKPYVSDKNIKVHNGFKGAMEMLVKEMIPNLKSMLLYPYDDYDLVLTGHSFGGTIASLAALKIKNDLNLEWSRISLYTYGQMRVGNVKFAQWYNKLPFVVSRGVNFNDPAPHIFYKEADDFYAHYQNEIHINSLDASTWTFCNSSLLEDPKCSNSIDSETYSMASHLSFFDTDFSREGAC